MDGPRRSPGGVSLEGLSRRFGEVRAVDEVTLRVEPGSLVSLLGPSGCGKSTLLRLVSGLETPDAGRIEIDGRDVTRASPRVRPTAMVFQSYALFPNMTVSRNVAYGLDVRRVRGEDRRSRVEAALARVGMATLADRPVTGLSGGQQQRVAVARALAVEPSVLLFDEPLSNLDIALRERTREELRALQQALGITAIWVTHDQQEALAVSDRIAIMRSGRILQTGRPEDLYENPDTSFVAGFLGGANIIRGVAGAAISGERVPPDRVLAARPEQITFAAEGLGGRILSRRYLGTHLEWRVETDGGVVRVHTPLDTLPEEETRLRARRWRWVADDPAD